MKPLKGCNEFYSIVEFSSSSFIFDLKEVLLYIIYNSMGIITVQCLPLPIPRFKLYDVNTHHENKYCFAYISNHDIQEYSLQCKKMNESIIHDQSCRWDNKTESRMNLLELGEDIWVKQACNLRATLLWANKVNKYV